MRQGGGNNQRNYGVIKNARFVGKKRCTQSTISLLVVKLTHILVGSRIQSSNWETTFWGLWLQECCGTKAISRDRQGKDDQHPEKVKGDRVQELKTYSPILIIFCCNLSIQSLVGGNSLQIIDL